MQDAFALLQLPRRPWLEEPDVRAAFQSAAAKCHPDSSSGSTADFAELTKAYQTLRQPSSRIRHLLAIEAPGQPATNAVPAELVALFPEMARVREEIEAWNQRRQKTTGALQRALQDHELSRIRSRADEAGQELMQAAAAALSELREADHDWPSAGALRALPGLQARFAFLEKWQAQLREALLRLEIGQV